MAQGNEGEQSNRLPEDVKALARGASFAHLATLMRDGSPHRADELKCRSGGLS